MKELAGLPGLCDAMHEVKASHLLVGNLRVDADHLRMIKGRNEAEIMTGGSHVDVAARLIGLGFQREAVLIAAVEIVFAKVVDGLAQALDGLIGAAASIGLDAFAAAP